MKKFNLKVSLILLIAFTLLISLFSFASKQTIKEADKTIRTTDEQDSTTTKAIKKWKSDENERKRQGLLNQDYADLLGQEKTLKDKFSKLDLADLSSDDKDEYTTVVARLQYIFNDMSSIERIDSLNQVDKIKHLTPDYYDARLIDRDLVAKYGVVLPKQATDDGLLYSIGDSTVVGWNALNDGAKPYAGTLAAQLNEKYDTSAISGTLISRDLTKMTQNAIAKPDFKTANNVIIGIGVNDVNYGDATSTLDRVIETYENNIKTIQSVNKNAKITLVLPFGDYQDKKNNDVKGAGGFSINDLRQAIQIMSTKLGVQTYDAAVDGIIDQQNHATTIPDGVHPSARTYTELASDLQAKLTTIN